MFDFGFTEPRSTVCNMSSAEACLTADPGIASSIPAGSHTFVKINHKIISKAISFCWFKKGCQLQAKVGAQYTG